MRSYLLLARVSIDGQGLASFGSHALDSSSLLDPYFDCFVLLLQGFPDVPFLPQVVLVELSKNLLGIFWLSFYLIVQLSMQQVLAPILAHFLP